MSEVNNLPEGWKFVPVAEMGRIETGTTPPKANPAFYGTEFPFYKPTDLEAGDNVVKSNDGLTKLGVDEARYVPENSILVTCIGATIGKTGFIKKGGAFNQQINAIVPNEKINPKFLYYQVIGLGFQKQILDNASSTTLPIINKGKFKQLLVASCPPEKQNQIVSKIEELFSELDNGIENLRTAQQQLKTYRQSVLKWAFEGKLTEDWRARNLVPQAGTQTKHLKVQRVENELLDVPEERFELAYPVEWKWVKLNEVAETCLGKMLDKAKNKGYLQPYLRNINVRWGWFDQSDLLEMRFEASEETRYALKQGDLVICEGGEPGRAAVWKERNSKIKIQKALHRVRFKNGNNVYFFYHYLTYAANTKLLNKYFTGTTIKHFTGQQLKAFEYPLPSTEEQQAIVEAIESRLSVADKIEETISQSLQQAEALRQSILKRAFEGKLVKV